MNIKLIRIILGVLSYSNIFAQTYQINFTATGESSTIDSVKVENQTQCTGIDIGGGDILHLVDVIGMDDVDSKRDKSLCIYPNPFNNSCQIEFDVPASGVVILTVSDMNGRIFTQLQKDLTVGKHSFDIRGLCKGVYFVQLTAETYTYKGKLISISAENGIPDIVYQGSSFANESSKKQSYKDLKNTSSLVQMQYNAGDLLKLTAKSGIYRTVIMLVPTSNQTVNFNFINCTDANGNHYAVVKIGDQWWMAENLNVGTYAVITSPQVFGTKFCMDINGIANPSCPMGGLYEWENLMQGGTPCNGTGAPPADQCTAPIKGLCPDGWHIPSHYEWTTLARNAGSSPASFPYDMSVGVLGTDEGGNLKTTCTTDWWSPNAGATNITGFSGIPGGDTWQGVFEDFGQSAYFWTSTWSYASLPWVYALNYSISVVGRSLYVRENGFSCRCIKN